MRAKYVMTPGEIPVVFPLYVAHDTFKNLNPISAGFVNVDSNRVVDAFGDSVSLNLKSRERDAKIIQLAFNIHERF